MLDRSLPPDKRKQEATEMLGPTNIHEAMDDSLESWCLLVLQPGSTDGEEVAGWHLGFGNTANLTKIESKTEGTEDELLSVLDSQHLEPHRHGDVTTTVITPLNSTLPRFRRRSLVYSRETTLRGLRHLSLEELLVNYFGKRYQLKISQSSSQLDWLPVPPDDEAGSELIKAMWKSMNQISPLVPYGSLQGRPL